MENNIIERMEDIRVNLETVRVLVGSADNTVSAVLREGEPANVYAALIWNSVRNIQVLLNVVNRYLFELDEQQETIISMVENGQESAPEGAA